MRAGSVEAVASWDLAEEIVEVLRRPKLARYGLDENDIKAVLVLLAPVLPSLEVEAVLRDPDDAPVLSAAVSGDADAIVTGDADLLEDPGAREWLHARDIAVLTPAELVERLGA